MSKTVKLAIGDYVWAYEVKRGDEVLGVVIREVLWGEHQLYLHNVSYAWLPGVTLDDVETSLGKSERGGSALMGR